MSIIIDLTFDDEVVDAMIIEENIPEAILINDFVAVDDTVISIDPEIYLVKTLDYKCIHNKRKYDCRSCGIYKCIHNKRKYDCRSCAIYKCKHKRQRNQCGECENIPKCVDHGKNKYKCRKCESNRCVHKHYKYDCKKCKAEKVVEKYPSYIFNKND